MYKTNFLLESLDSFIESIEPKLSAEELEHISLIRNNIAQSKSDEEIEKWFFDLLGWLMLLKEFLENTS